MPAFDYENIDLLIQGVGDCRMTLVNQEGTHVEIPLSLHDLIDYIHTTGSCASRHNRPQESEDG